MNDIIKQSESEFNEKFSMYTNTVAIAQAKNLPTLYTNITDYVLAWHKSQMELAYKKGVEDVKKHLQVECLDYCEQQNGLDHCKNCGLSIELIDEMK